MADLQHCSNHYSHFWGKQHETLLYQWPKFVLAVQYEYTPDGGNLCSAIEAAESWLVSMLQCVHRLEIAAMCKSIAA